MRDEGEILFWAVMALSLTAGGFLGFWLLSMFGT